MPIWQHPPGRGYRRTHRQAESQVDKIMCRVCGFPVDVETSPGEGFPTSFTVTGSTYVWASADDALSTLDKTVTPVPNTAVSCPFCGSTRFMDGNRGTQ